MREPNIPQNDPPHNGNILAEAQSNPLLAHHCEQLTQGSGIALEVILARGYRSILPAEGYSDLKQLGFSPAQAKLTPGLLIPIHDMDGGWVLHQYKPDEPRVDGKGKVIKYETPKGARMRLDCAARQRDDLGNPAIGLWVTEGIKKTDALRTHGLCAIGLLGVSNWRGANVDGGKVALPDWERVALNNRDVYIVFDSDVATNSQVQRALRRLRGFLASRGAKPVVVLLAANGQNKVGVDDFLLTHTVQDLVALATRDPHESPEGDPPPPPYRSTSRGLVWIKQTFDGDISVPLTNFGAKIIGEIVQDNGAETTHHFEIETTLAGRSQRLTVPAAQFAGLSWIIEHLGARALVYPGQAIKDRARAAIQLLSDVIVERRIFTHTGWRSNRDGVWHYFHGGGILGGNGSLPNMEVKLPASLAPLVLPDPPHGDDLKEAVRASLQLLEIAPARVSVPVYAATWRAVLGRVDFGVHLSGPTGNGKTELATLAQQHYGAGFDARTLPGSWASTGNSLEDLAFIGKDVILVIDDFSPTGTPTDIARMHREADRVLRAQGNGAGRGRLRADGSQRPARPPRGLVLSTGEDVPRGQSLRARVVIVELSPGDLNWGRLTTCQRDAAAGLYARVMAGYIRWLAPQYERIRQDLPSLITRYRDQAYRSGRHLRAVANIASLASGMQYFLHFAEVVGSITNTERESLWTRSWTALLDASAQQQRYQEASEPTGHFLRMISAALASGRAHLAGLTGEIPDTPQAYGWRQTIGGDGYDATPNWQAQGKRVGWIDGQDIYLEPEASYAESQILATQQGEGLAVSAQTLRKRLDERHLLITTGKTTEGRETLLVRRSIEGRRRDVLHLSILSLSLEREKPDQPDQPADTRASGQVFPDQWSGNGERPDQGKPLKDTGSIDAGQVGQVFRSVESQSWNVGKNDHSECVLWSGSPENLTRKPDQRDRDEPGDRWPFPT
jgi:hypothetical protein